MLIGKSKKLSVYNNMNLKIYINVKELKKQTEIKYLGMTTQILNDIRIIF